MSIELPDLPYSLNALEPYMSQTTMKFHYEKHHKHYVDTLNELILGTPLERQNLEEIMSSSFGNDQKVYNNAAQAWNHGFFWNCMTPSLHSPSPDLTKTIEKSFGSLHEFKEKFETEAKNLFGSGWAWLVKDRLGKLKIRSLENAGNPINEFKDTPLLTCDVWEHAYYLDYQNERPKYLENFWNVVDWEFVEANLNMESARSGFSQTKPSRNAFSQGENRV